MNGASQPTLPLGARASQGLASRAYARMEQAPATDLTPREALRRKLAARYGIQGEYVGAATVARILGLGLTTVYEQAKAGRFVIPHRLSNRKPLFLLDDLVAWMAGSAENQAHTAAPESATPAAHIQVAPVHLFKHPEAEEAFLRVCEARGIKLPRSRR